MIGKWIVCKRDGREYNPRMATPYRIANVTNEAGYKKFNREMVDGKKDYAFFESYSTYFKKRDIDLGALPITDY